MAAACSPDSFRARPTTMRSKPIVRGSGRQRRRLPPRTTALPRNPRRHPSRAAALANRPAKRSARRNRRGRRVPPAVWPDFRGPARDGRSAEVIRTDWPAGGLPQLWKQPIGLGYASFVVADGRAFTIEQRRRAGGRGRVRRRDRPRAVDQWVGRRVRGVDGRRRTARDADLSRRPGLRARRARRAALSGRGDRQASSGAATSSKTIARPISSGACRRRRSSSTTR